MISFKRKKSILLLTGTLLSCLYAILLCYDIPMSEYLITRDSSSYEQAGDYLLNGKLHSIRTLGYPSVLLLIDKISSSEVFYQWCIYLLQVILWIGILKMCIRFIPAKKGAWSLLIILLFINPSFVRYAGLIMTEVYFTFWVVLGFVFLQSYFKKEKTIQAFLFIISLCITTLIRPGFLYFTLISIALCSFYLLVQKKYLSTLVIIIASILLLAVPMRIMKRTYGNFTLSYIDKVTQYRYLNSQCIALMTGNSVQNTMKERDAQLRLKKLDLPTLSINTSKETKQLLIQNPAKLLQAFGKNLFTNFHAGNNYLRTDLPVIGKHLIGLSRIINMLFVIALLVITPMFIIRFLRTKPKKKYFFSGVLLLYCFYCWFTSGISFFQGDRFNIIWMPLFVIFLFSFFSLKNESTRT